MLHPASSTTYLNDIFTGITQDMSIRLVTLCCDTTVMFIPGEIYQGKVDCLSYLCLEGPWGITRATWSVL